MPRAHVLNKVKVSETARLVQLRGMFDLASEKTSEVQVSAEVPGPEEDWRVGLIVGPSARLLTHFLMR